MSRFSLLGGYAPEDEEEELQLSHLLPLSRVNSTDGVVTDALEDVAASKEERDSKTAAKRGRRGDFINALAHAVTALGSRNATEVAQQFFATLESRRAAAAERKQRNEELAGGRAHDRSMQQERLLTTKTEAAIDRRFHREENRQTREFQGAESALDRGARAEEGRLEREAADARQEKQIGAEFIMRQLEREHDEHILGLQQKDALVRLSVQHTQDLERLNITEKNQQARFFADAMIDGGMNPALAVSVGTKLANQQDLSTEELAAYQAAGEAAELRNQLRDAGGRLQLLGAATDVAKAGVNNFGQPIQGFGASVDRLLENVGAPGPASSAQRSGSAGGGFPGEAEQILEQVLLQHGPDAAWQEVATVPDPNERRRLTLWLERRVSNAASSQQQTYK